MNNNILLEKIKKNTAFLVDHDVEELYLTSISTINKILESEGTLNIENFGTFHRRSNNGTACTVFKAAEELKKQINK